MVVEAAAASVGGDGAAAVAAAPAAAADFGWICLLGRVSQFFTARINLSLLCAMCLFLKVLAPGR